MNLIDWCERGLIPDPLTRVGIRRFCSDRLADEHAGNIEAEDARYRRRLNELRQSPVAIHTDAANQQHYELPPGFFERCLGARLKYSSCYYETGSETLNQAEEAMLSLYNERAELRDGMDVLELGCGWGSMTLWMAEKFPKSRITAISNSKPQREFILARAAAKGLGNVRVITVDVNHFDIEDRFDRVVSIEMFEHMRNYQTLLGRIAQWLKPGGKLFVHIFCHKQVLYPFETEGDGNWMGKYFFTGGLMPSFDTLLHFQRDLRIEETWRVSGRHYQQTSEHWLANTDRERSAILEVFKQTYGATDAARWLQRWRMFYLACAELFGYQDGNQWLLGHYRFSKP